ncbi:MAG TPA: hypothetical protein VNK95_20485 [Caldilineaceae bacterium]|nr:hypothetical protein [Caldilineaceae bacterium]
MSSSLTNPERSSGPEPHELPVDPESLAEHHEVHDVSLRGIIRFAVALVVAAAVIHIVLYFALAVWSGRGIEEQPVRIQMVPAEVTPPAVPGPGLESAPSLSLEQWQAQEMETLTTYGWVDREGGVVRIPIEEAMQRLLEQGAPAREGEPPNFGLDPAYRLDSSGGLEPVEE